MPEKDPDTWQLITGALGSLLTLLWGFLMYRVWDVQKSIAKAEKKLVTKMEKDDAVKATSEVKKEVKADFRYYDDKVTDAINGLAESLRAEIKDSIKEVYNLIEKLRK